MFPFISSTVLCIFSLVTSSELDNVDFFTFDCADKPIGFYADVQHKCQIFHICNQEGRRIPHRCATGTGFNQEYRICDWLANFDCSEAPKWYHLNGLTYEE